MRNEHEPALDVFDEIDIQAMIEPSGGTLEASEASGPPPIDESAIPEPPATPAWEPAAFYESQEAKAKKFLDGMSPEIDRWRGMVAALSVRSADEQRTAAELLIPLAKAEKAVEEARKRFVEAPNKYVKKINNFAGAIRDRLGELTGQVKAKLADYAAHERLEAAKRRAEEENARKAIERELAAEVVARNEAARAADPEAALIVLEPLPASAPSREPKKTVRSEGGSVTSYVAWDFRIVDPGLVPREYLKVDETAIRAAVKLGAREIPGVDVFESTKIRVG